MEYIDSIMMCTTTQEIEQKLNRNVDINKARKALLKEIQTECRPTNMMSSNRINVSYN